MSDSSERRKLARIRRCYSSEPKWAAGGGVGRGSIGFDICTPSQRQFRVLLALLLLNDRNTPRCLVEPSDDRTFLDCGVSRLLSYTIAFSARYDDFVVLSNMPDHIVQSVIDESEHVWTHGVPGLRRERTDEKTGSLVFRHLPTGATLRFRYCDWYYPARKKPSYTEDSHFWRSRDGALVTAEEESVLKAVPPMHPDSERLLAGLIARIWLSSEEERWAVSGLIWDSLRGRIYGDHGWSFTYLWGSGTDWLLRWGGSGSVPPSDVARALVHNHVGIEGANARGIDDARWEVSLGAARVILEYHCHRPNHGCDCRGPA